MSPLSQGQELKSACKPEMQGSLPSPLSQGRELKLPGLHRYLFHILSPLSQGRELKLAGPVRKDKCHAVAPLAGAGIEMMERPLNTVIKPSPLSQGRELA